MRDKFGRFIKGHRIPQTEETKQKIRNALLGHIVTKETKEKLRRINIGKQLLTTTREKISKSHKGKKLSEKTKKKISKSLKGEKSFRWKGGRYKNIRGYVYIYNPNHPFCTKDGYVREHRLVMEKHIRRYLKPKEVVHHVNGIKDDNRLKNLKLFKNNHEHLKYGMDRKI